jgi:hypothetical protein
MTNSIPSELVIEYDVPIPPGNYRNGGRPRPLLRNWERLKVGGSTVVDSMAAAKSAREWAMRRGYLVAVRKQKERPYGFRVWRVA